MVGIVGLRQVGKTTLVSRVTRKFGGEFASLDERQNLIAAQDEPEAFLNRPRLFCVDEVQREPLLFPKIKELVGIERRPGRFLLTGSIRFTLKNEIKESLTGRIVTFELLPFSHSEAHEIKPSVFLAEAFKLAQFGALGDVKTARKAFEAFLRKARMTQLPILARHAVRGGLPIPCFTRDAEQRAHWQRQYLETLITRDLSLYDVRLQRIGYRQGMAALTELARSQQQEINVSRLTGLSGLSRPLLQSFLRALEALCVIDFIPSERRRQKAVKKAQIQWKDSGLWSAVTHANVETVAHSQQAVNLLLSTEFRSQLQFVSGPVLWHYYRHRDGSHIPWIFKKGDASLVITHLPVEDPNLNDVRLLSQFIRDDPKSLALVLTASNATPRIIRPRMIALPLNWVF